MAEWVAEEHGGGGGTSTQATTPAGLAVGDKMVFFVSSFNATDTQTWSPPTGWVSLFNGGNTGGGSTHSWQVFWKIATADDVSAPTTGSFSASSGGGTMVAVCFAVRGTDTAAPTYIANSVDDNNTVTTTGLTPPGANSLLVIIGNAVDNDSTSVSQGSYAIATSNPSWTEAFDYSDASINENSVSLAYAIRPEATATSTSTVVATPSTGTVDSYLQVLLAFAPSPNYSITAEGTSYALTMGEATITFIDPDVLNTAKPSTSIDNVAKP